MLDLHMHTKYSDGTDDVVTILKKAEKMNLKCIAITDHNNCNSYEELENMDIKKYYSGKIIAGIELNTKILNIPIEILGYGVDPKIMNELASKVYLTAEKRNEIELERLYQKCKDANIELPEDFLERYDKKSFASKYLHNEITKNENNKKYIDEESWGNSNIFYRKYMSNPSTIFFVDTSDILPSFQEAADLVRKAHGKVFIPHIYEYRTNSNRILENILENYQIDGIECYYSTFTKEQSEYLLNLCKERGFKVSGGSDYHGTFKPDTEMAIGKGNLRVPDEIIENWGVEFWHK